MERPEAGTAIPATEEGEARRLRILMIDDSPEDAEIIQRELRKRGLPFEARWVQDRDGFVRGLEEFRPHVVLSDHAMPAFDGAAALALVRRRSRDLPFIFVSGSIGEERAVEALTNGANDYILKDRLARLGPAVLRAVREAEVAEERRQLEQQFRQAQKMEAIGQLASGVAHDFNNLLTVISGYVELALGKLPEGDPMKGQLAEVRRASERAAGLTRQLLTISRKQVANPRVLDLNEVVGGMDKMLRRLIRADISYETSLGKGLGRVRADPGQVEQVLMNLVVNARDALPQGGKLTVETGNVNLGAEAARSRLGVRPGPHVMLAVSDTGHGMDAETLERIFEPFFTTKGEGKGTGLGLATVYGIVKQSGGSIFVYSEPGQGTTFKVYLPRADVTQEAVDGAETGPVAQGGTERILLVEDTDPVRILAASVLRGLGYEVVEARNPEEALDICRKGGPGLHLLVTDVVMPGMSGRALADRVLAHCPEARVLYVSGYADDAIVRHGILTAGTNFLQKPFSPMDLGKRVREILDAPQEGVQGDP
jgi:signal transduction histidine kinase